MDIKNLTRQNYTEKELYEKYNLIFKDEVNLIEKRFNILVGNISVDTIYDRIMDIFDKINEDYTSNIYGNNVRFATVYNDIMIDIEDDTDYKYSYLTFSYNKNNVNENDLILLENVFKFLIE